MSDEVVHTPLTVFMEGLVPGADPAHWDELTQFGRFSSETFESTKKSCVAYEFCRMARKVFNTCKHKMIVGDLVNSLASVKCARGSNRTPDIVVFPHHDDALMQSISVEVDRRKRENIGAVEAMADHQAPFQEAYWGMASLVIDITTQSLPHLSRFDKSIDEEDFAAMSDELSREASDGRRLITEYAANILRCQQRQFCFMIVVRGRCARFIRWDRAGAIVSEYFDFIRDPTPMFTFLFRYGNMTKVQQGHDPSAVLADLSEIQEMRDCRAGLSEYHQGCLDDALSDGWPIYKISVRAEDIIRPEDLQPDNSDSVVTSNSRPGIGRLPNLFGRSGRGYLGTTGLWACPWLGAGSGAGSGDIDCSRRTNSSNSS